MRDWADGIVGKLKCCTNSGSVLPERISFEDKSAFCANVIFPSNKSKPLINFYFSNSDDLYFNLSLKHYLWFKQLQIDTNLNTAIKIIKSWRRNNKLDALKGEVIEWLVYYSANEDNSEQSYCYIVIFWL